MATLVKYTGPLGTVTVTASDGKTYTCPFGQSVSIPDDTAIALFGEGTFTAPDGSTPGYVPPVPIVFGETFLANGVLSTYNSLGAVVPVSTSGITSGDVSVTSGVATVNSVQGGKGLMAQQVDSLAWIADTNNPLFASAAGGVGEGGSFGDVWVDGSGTFHFYGMVDGTTPGIYHWTSPTGRAGTWTADVANPILVAGTTGLWDAGSVGVPCVWSEGSTIFMIYRGTDGSGNVKLGKATAATSNPSVWTKSGSNPVFTGSGAMAGSEAGPGRLIKLTSAVGGLAAGTYVLWISTISGYNRWCSYATAPDLGSNNGPGAWTQAAVNPVFTGGRFCNCVWTDGSFFYSIVPHYTGFATSAELELWRSPLPTFPHNQRDYLGVRRINTANAWEAQQYDTPTVLCDNITKSSQLVTGGKPWVYYAGAAASGLFLTGLLLPQTSHSPAPIDRKHMTFVGPWQADNPASNLTAVQLALNATALAITGDITNASASVVNLAGSVPAIGTKWNVVGTGIPATATLLITGATTGTLSANATATTATLPMALASRYYFRNPFSCSVVSVGLTTNSNVTAGSITAKLTNWLGNAAYTFFPSGGLAVALSSGKSQAGIAAEEGDYFFAAGEGFGIQLTTSAGLTPTTLSVDVTVGIVPR